jgi:hypothetical protein
MRGIVRALIMANVKEDPDREERITMEAIVDAYGTEEQAIGWYYYSNSKFKILTTS